MVSARASGGRSSGRRIVEAIAGAAGQEVAAALAFDKIMYSQDDAFE
jgi:hypothetical protein